MSKKAPSALGEQVTALSDAPLVGREAERARISQALAQGTMPHSLLLTGEAGVGKRRLAIWAAQAVLCSKSTEQGPCDACSDCKQARKLAHPDLHVFLPHGKPDGSNPDAQLESLNKSLQPMLEAMREDALYGENAQGAYYAASGRAIGRLVHQRPSSGSRRVILLLGAEKLSAHAGATEASNALLKVLEEPPAGTHFVLTAPSRHALLPTLQSRTTEMRLPPLKTEDIEAVLKQARPEADLESPEIKMALMQGRGSMSGVRNWLDPEWQEVRMKALEALRTGLLASNSARFALINEQGFKGARGDFSDMLAHLEELCSQATTLVTFGKEAVQKTDPRLTRLLKVQPKGSAAHDPAIWTEVLRSVMEGRGQASGNAGPMLVLNRILKQMQARFAWAPAEGEALEPRVVRASGSPRVGS